MKNPLVSIIIVNFNGKHWLETCLESIKKQKYGNIEVIIVDNNSVDGSISYVETNFPKSKIISLKENFGYAQANNIGFDNSDGEYILFLNNDTEVTLNFLENLLKSYRSDSKNGCIQNKILFMDEPDKLDSVGSFLTPLGMLYHYGAAKKDSKKYQSKIEIFSAKGASMMISRKILKKVLVNNEVFDSSYFAYFEETDLCHRIWLAGYKVVFEPNSVVYHKVGATSQKLNNAFVQYHSFKNRINSHIKNLSMKKLFIILPTHLLFVEFYAIFSLLTFKINLFFAIQKALIWNVINLSKTLQKRKYIRSKIAKDKDDKYFSKIYRKVRLSYYYYLLVGLENFED